MTAGVLDRPTAGGAARSPAGGRSAEAPVLGGTLEALLSATLHAARTNGSTECPVCHASIGHASITSSRAGAREAAPVAECGSCGSRVS